MVLGGADLPICVDYFAWQLPDSTVTQIACLRQHKQTHLRSAAFEMYVCLQVVSGLVPVPRLAEGATLNSSLNWINIINNSNYKKRGLNCFGISYLKIGDVMSFL